MADPLAGDVQVPAVGKVPKKYAVGGLLVVGTLVIVYYVRKHNASSATTAAAAASTSTDQYPPDGTTGNPQDPYSTDPATGQTYGDEAAGSGGQYGAYGTGYPYGYNPYGSGSPPASTTGTGGPPFNNNSQWSNWVIQQIETQNPSQSVGALTDALGLYLEGQQVDPTQQQLIFDAEAIGGPPPVAGPNGYPPNVHLNGSKGPGGTVNVPNVTGQTAGAAHNAIVAAGLVPRDANGAVPGESSWIVQSTTPAAGTQVTTGSDVDINAAKGIAVPNVTGQTAGAAHNAIQAAGLVPRDANGAVPGESAWKVVSTTPPAGTQVARGSDVDINAQR